MSSGPAPDDASRDTPAWVHILVLLLVLAVLLAIRFGLHAFAQSLMH